jgi:hypothetical protein
MEECYATESLVGSHCGQETDLSDNDDTIRNDGEMNGSNAEDNPDKIANGGSSRGNGSGGEFIRGSRDDRPFLLMPTVVMVLVGIFA